MKSEIEALIFIPRFCFNDRRIALFSVIFVKNERTQKNSGKNSRCFFSSRVRTKYSNRKDRRHCRWDTRDAVRCCCHGSITAPRTSRKRKCC